MEIQLPRLGYRVTFCVSSMDMPERIVLTFHGLGGDQHTMSPISAYCSRHLRSARFLPIEGPINLGDERQPCRGWFEPPDDNHREMDGPQRPRLSGLKRSLAVVHETINQLVESGADPLTIHLLGHSQGGAIAIAAGLTYPTKLGSVSTIAGYLALTPDMKPLPTGTRYFFHHSEHDDNVAFRWADYARSFVDRAGNYGSVRAWDFRDNPHAVHVEQLDAICKTIADA